MRRAVVIISIILCSILVFGPLNILKRTMFPGDKNVTNLVNERYNVNMANALRIPETSPQKLGLQVSKILYPAGEWASKPKGFILVPGADWKEIMSAITLAKIYESTIIPVDSGDSLEVQNYIKRVEPEGMYQLSNAQVLILGRFLSPINEGLKAEGVRTRYISYSDFDDMQRQIYELPLIDNENKIGFMISGEKPLMGIPAASLIASQGGTLLFCDKNNRLYKSSRDILAKGKIKKIYVIGSKNLYDEEIFKKLKVDPISINGSSPETLAVKTAKFYDRGNGVGWNANRNRDDNEHNFILCSKSNPALAVTGAQLALKGKSGPLLWSDSKSLSPATENYLWRMKPNYWVTAAEGPYNNIWVIGDNNHLDYTVQARADFTQQISPYSTLGDESASGLETLSIVWILLSFYGAAWVGIHAFHRMKKLLLQIKIMWILTSLLLGPIGVWMYFISYHNSPCMRINGIVMWLRPLWKQTGMASMTEIAFGASTMIAGAYLITSAGLPLVPYPTPGGLFIFGNPIIIEFIIVFIAAFVLNSYLFMPTVEMSVQSMSYRAAVRKSLSSVLISLTSLFIGMMLCLWWLNMAYSPNIPDEDNVLWWGFMQFSVLIGALTAYIPNWWLVRYGKKMGTL